MTFKIIKNFLSDFDQKQLESFLISTNFPWYYNDETADESSKNTKSVRDSWQLVHSFFQDKKVNSTNFDIIKKLFYKTKIKYKNFIRIKANFTANISNLKKSNYQPIHTDIDITAKKTYSFLYYVNNSDGDTIFFDKKNNEIDRFTPKRGYGLLFNSKIPHSGCNPIKNNKRIVINYVFEV